MTIFDQGVQVDMESVAASGQHIDGSWWVVPNHADGVGLKSYSIAPDQTADLFVGGSMLDPGRPDRPNIKKHGFDWRTVGNKTNPAGAKVGSGPGNTYDSTYALALPRRVKPYANGPVTIWIYRGVDNSDFTSGGGATACARMVQITVYASAPSAAAIKPPGMYVATGKPMKTRADINYSALPSLALPSGAVQPNWDSDFGFHKFPIWRWGNRNEAAAISPKRTQEQYPADQSVLTNMTVLGCCYNIAKRSELIERLVRDGMDYHAGTAFAPHNNAFFSGGGFGPAGRLPRFLAGVVLNDSAYFALPPQVYSTSDSSGSLIEFFAEDCSTYWSVKKNGDVASPTGTYQALFGTREVARANDNGDYIASHTSRDIAKLRDSYRIAQFTWVVETVGEDFFTVTAASHDATKFYQPHNNTNQGYHRACRIMTGAAAGSFVFLSQNVGGVDVGWNAATRKVTVERTQTWAQTVVMPSVGDTVEYRPAAVYDQIVMGALTGTALAVVTMGRIAEYCVSEDIRAMFMRAKQFIDDNGLDTDKFKMAPPFQRSGNANSRMWGPGEVGGGLPAGSPLAKWQPLIYAQQVANWPTFTGPLTAPAPTAYFDSGTTSAQASRTDAVDNGLYDVLVRNGSTTEWKRVGVLAGSCTLTGPGGGQITRAQYYGPLKIAPKSTGAYGPALAYAGLYNSRGHSEFGDKAGLRMKATWSKNSPDVAPAHQGWCVGGPGQYLLAEGDVIYSRKRNPGQADDWSLLGSTTTGLAAITGVGHLGAPGYRPYNNRVYFAVSDWTGNAATTKKLVIACFDATTRSLIAWWPTTDVVGRAADGITFDEANGIAYICDYGDSGKIWQYDLTVLDEIPSGQSADPAQLTTLYDANVSSAYFTAQGIKFYNGLIYQGGKQNGGTTGTCITLRDPSTGKYAGEVSYVQNTSGGQEGFDFDNGQLGIMISGTTDNVNYFDLPAAPAYSKAGMTFAGFHGTVLTGTKPQVDYTQLWGGQLTQFTAADGSGKPGLWDQRGNASNHEGQIESSGVVTTKASATAIASPAMTVNTRQYAAVSYVSSTGATVAMTRSGAQTAFSTVAGSGTPVAYGSYGGGITSHPQNGRTVGLHSLHLVFNAALTSAQLDALIADPTLAFDATNGLTADQKTAAEAS